MYIIFSSGLAIRLAWYYDQALFGTQASTLRSRPEVQCIFSFMVISSCIFIIQVGRGACGWKSDIPKNLVKKKAWPYHTWKCKHYSKDLVIWNMRFYKCFKDTKLSILHSRDYFLKKEQKSPYRQGELRVKKNHDVHIAKGRGGASW